MEFSANIKLHHFYVLYIIMTFLYFFQSLQQRLSKRQTNFIALTETEHLNKNVKRHVTHYRRLL